jgi:hypothetical protein
MPALKNPKWEAFAQAVALNMPAAQAYRDHVASDPDGPALSIDPAASKLANDNKVATRIEELRGKVAARVEKKFDMTKDKRLDELAAIAKESRETGDFSAATGALREIGKGAAFYAPEKVEHSANDPLLAALNAIKGITHG